MITLVVFSKDRAMQLDSLLRSVKDHCTGIDWIAAVVDASSDLHERAYDKLAAEYEEPGGFRMLRQRAVGSLGVALGTACKHGEHLALAVDDQLFYAPSDFKKAAFSLDEHNAFVWSWRLGLRPNRIETERCPCPFDEADPHWLCSAFDMAFERFSKKLYFNISWAINATLSANDDPNYGYLWHSDGALYRTATYTRMLDAWLPDWRTGDYTPNDLEGLVAGRAARWKPSTGPHVGPLSPTCITWQLNLARRAYASGSPAFELPETRLDALAQAYLDGKRVDNEKLYTALRENPLRFNQPGDRPTHVRACEEASRFWAGCVR